MEDGYSPRRNAGRGRKPSGGGLGCFQCGKAGHFARDCPEKPKKAATSSKTQDSMMIIDVRAPTFGFIDTHCHVEYVMQKMRQNSFAEWMDDDFFPMNFEGLISVFCDPAALSPSFGTWREQLEHPKVWGIFGIHPHQAKNYSSSVEERLVECLKHPKAVAWGEIGLDFFKNHSERDKQKEVFILQIAKAVELGKPIVIHSRDAEDDTFEILTEHTPKDWYLHVHCYQDSKKQAERLMAHFPNLYFGFTGSITFPSAKEIRSTIETAIPLERILLETDAPYLAPSPAKKGTICTPAAVPIVANHIAQLKGCSVEKVLEIARLNTKKMYGV